VSPGNENEKPGAVGPPANSAASGRDPAPQRPAIPRTMSLKFEAPKPPPGYRPDPDPNAAATITADIAPVAPTMPPEPVATPEKTPVGPPVFAAPRLPEPTPAPEKTPAGLEPTRYVALKPPAAFEPEVTPWKTPMPASGPTPAAGFPPTTQKVPEPAAPPQQQPARDVTAKLDLIAARAAAAARELSPAQRKALVVLAGMAAALILVLVFGSSALREKPTERELWMAYPYGNQGATGVRGERAPASDELEYKYLEEVLCKDPTYDRCLRYRYSREDFAGTMVVGKKHGGIWERVSGDDGMPFRVPLK
jgi:hypothetical protein